MAATRSRCDGVEPISRRIGFIYRSRITAGSDHLHAYIPYIIE